MSTITVDAEIDLDDVDLKDIVENVIERINDRDMTPRLMKALKQAIQIDVHHDFPIRGKNLMETMKLECILPNIERVSYDTIRSVFEA